MPCGKICKSVVVGVRTTRQRNRIAQSERVSGKEMVSVKRMHAQVNLENMNQFK